ncbi:MAG: hypothetical protein L3J11_10895 [Draconibacterium sp.]|nr:hypothetical protein [Draconibacterium sp.]
MEKSDSPELEYIKKEIQVINERLTAVESSLLKLKGQNISANNVESIQEETEFEIKLPFQSEGSIEFRVGEYGMAWLGNIVLFFGITFLVGYFQNSGFEIFSAAAGFITVAGIYICSWFTRNSYSYLSKLFAYNGHLLIYYLTLRLHFFQTDPLVKNEILGLIFSLMVAIVLLYKAFQKKSQLMTGLVLLMILITGIVSNSTHFSAALVAITALVTVLFYYRFGWLKLTFAFIFLVYIVHLNWLLNNPILGNSPEFIATPGMGYLYFIVTGFIFSMLAIIPKKEEVSNDFIITSLIWNGLGFTTIMALVIVTYFESNYVSIFAAITFFCLIYSFILQSYSKIKIMASMYALYGFLALSVAIFGMFGLPKSYLLFALQSLLVVSMALWFRSRFIVTMNMLLFLGFMVFYLNDSGSSNSANFTFMLVAYISARVVNWKKERLNIKAELVRNVYLISGLIMTLIAFYHVSPSSYITASWIFAAVLLFLLSLLIKNIKYRWLAIAAMVASAIRLIFVDMSSIDIGYRVLVFLVLAVISITVSILYTKYLIKKRE